MEYKVQEYDNARLPAEKRKDITGECQKFIENVTDSMNKIMDSYAKAKEKSTKALQAQVMIGNEVKGFSSFSEAWAVGYNSGKDFTVRACQDISADTARGFNLSQLSEKFGFNSTKGFLVPEGREVAVELNGHTIDCSSLRGITLFDVQKGAVFTLRNGQVNGAAAAVRYSSHDKAETSLYMENVKIDRCSGTAVYFDGSNPSDKLMMHNCEINGAQNGAVVMEWRLTFSNNHAEYGAAVDALYAEDGSYVRNCRFTENTADKAAGALYCVSGVSRCVFENNKAGTDGGACGGWTEVSDSTFTGNTAGADGGAICAGCHAKLMADNTTIINNRAGGAYKCYRHGQQRRSRRRYLLQRRRIQGGGHLPLRHGHHQGQQRRQRLPCQRFRQKGSALHKRRFRQIRLRRICFFLLKKRYRGCGSGFQIPPGRIPRGLRLDDM